MIQASIIIALQNNLRFADLALASIERQTMRDVELVIIADNSSSDLVRTVQTRLPLLNIPSRIVWSQESLLITTREQQIITTALRTAQSEFLIFTDSNTILHSEFIADHCASCTRNLIVTGRRVELSESISESLRTDEVRDGWLEHKYWRVVSDGIFGQSTNVSRGFHFRSQPLRWLLNTRCSDIFSGNFSLYSQDAATILKSIETARELSIRNFTRSLGIEIVLQHNAIIQYHLNESSLIPLQLVPGVLERVKRLRYKVPEFGLQPAMLEAKRFRQQS